MPDLAEVPPSSSTTSGSAPGRARGNRATQPDEIRGIEATKLARGERIVRERPRLAGDAPKMLHPEPAFVRMLARRVDAGRTERAGQSLKEAALRHVELTVRVPDIARILLIVWPLKDLEHDGPWSHDLAGAPMPIKSKQSVGVDDPLAVQTLDSPVHNLEDRTTSVLAHDLAQQAGINSPKSSQHILLHIEPCVVEPGVPAWWSAGALPICEDDATIHGGQLYTEANPLTLKCAETRSEVDSPLQSSCARSCLVHGSPGCRRPGLIGHPQQTRSGISGYRAQT